MIKNLVILILAQSYFLNCALSEGTLMPSHPKAVADVEKLSKPISLKINTVEFPEFNGKVGIRKGGYGNEFPNVKIDSVPKPEIIFMKALELELKEAGFNIVESKADYEISLVILKYFSEPEVGLFAGELFANAKAEIFVKMKNGKIYKRKIMGVGNVVTLAWTDGFYTEALELALQDFMRQSIPVIKDLIQGKISGSTELSK